MIEELKPETIDLHEALIRAVKGAVTAWEKWLEKRKTKK